MAVFPPKNYRLYQEKSQQYLGPPTWYKDDEEPGDLTEVFLSNLPSSTTLSDVYFFIYNNCGIFYQIRLPVTLNQDAKGYAYVRFLTQEEATKAIQRLTGTYFHNVPLKVARSWDTRHVQVIPWPTWLNAQQSKSLLQTKLADVVDVRVEVCSNYQGYMVVEFKSHNAAAIGRRQIKEGALQIEAGSNLTTQYTRSDFDIPEEDFRQVQDLYVGNVPPNTTPSMLLDIVKNYIGPLQVSYIRVNNGFAFLYFKDHGTAAKALEKLKAASRYNDQLSLQFHWVKGKYAKKREDSSNSYSHPNLQQNHLPYNRRESQDSGMENTPPTATQVDPAWNSLFLFN